MKRALALARKGAGWVNPNPMVGAVVVKEDRILGEGFHALYGEAHAEAAALRDIPAGQAAGATLYVTLEPCAHTGKTPPCVHLIVEKKITRVVIAMQDPNPAVNGKGIRFLREAGIAVDTGVLETEARELNQVFVKYITTGEPFFVLKTAMTLDGKIATVTNASRWITGEASRRLVHRMRQAYSAVMVGADTILFDDPLLNIRLKGRWNQPLKVITDTRARIPFEAKVLTNDPQLTLIATTSLADPARLKEFERLGAQVLVCPLRNGRVDLRFLSRALGSMGIDSVMIEGGSTLAFSAIRENLVDQVITFMAPKILGGSQAPTAVGGEGFMTMEEAVTLRDLRIRKTGNDLMITGKILSTHQHINQHVHGNY